VWLAGARGHQYSPAVAGEDEEDEVEPVRDLPEHEWQWGCSAMEEESGGGSSSAQEWRRARENSGVRRKCEGCSRGGACHFIGARGRRGVGDRR
jgi:hypothetical protein